MPHSVEAQAKFNVSKILGEKSKEMSKEQVMLLMASLACILSIQYNIPLGNVLHDTWIVAGELMHNDRLVN